jgi:hypothetical protein
MHAHRRFLLLLGVLAVTVTTILGWQRQAAGKLHASLAWEQSQARELMRLTAEHQRLVANKATEAQIADVLAERALVAQLRAQLTTMQQRVQEAAATRNAPANVLPITPPSLTGNVLAYPLWQNAGQATPAAAFESILWASSVGDIDALVKLLAFEPEARSQAEALFAQLPAAVRQEFVSPERLIAFLAAKDVPLGSASILKLYPTPAETKVSAQIFDAEGKQKIALLSMRPEGADWRLVVPRNAIKRYSAWLLPGSVKTLPLP